MKLRYDSIEELVQTAVSHSKKISDIVMEQQAEEMEITVEELYHQMFNSFQVMKHSVEEGMNPELKSFSGLSGGAAAQMKAAVDKKTNHFGHLFGTAMAMALAVSEYNSCMGQIVAAPTAGSCGNSSCSTDFRNAGV